jgi:hypothetical protein
MIRLSGMVVEKYLLINKNISETVYRLMVGRKGAGKS